MRLSESTWSEVRDADATAALVPVGSTEQHGPHAPLGTDTLNAVSVAEAAADRYESDVGGDGDRTDEELLVAPPIPVGVAEEHRAFDGTLWVSPDTFRAYVRETAESLAHHGVEHVVFVNGHGGNVDALSETAARLSRDGTVYTLAFTWFDAVGDHSARMGHGGPLETAMLLSTNPELVRDDRIEDAGEGASDRWGEWVAGVNLAHDSAEFTDNGVVGDPGEADAELGAELLALSAAALVDLLAAMDDRR
ncbi:creatinine amidohydrolase [Halalkaliarchaeum desulfuricum]|uniref:Creatinine amidohydrolase n=1 Tax=Halalkaliarchaeum desulfuricum TaxID=2055893 RepID=A0A343TJ52_9EURY|nr:creatininase family protein [Halalkaliarchaeum desulfuricum]AUX09124.1 creatinine amidohydrolase [Halalkaliarchaeum desulfuricum]